jgi:hypothetical protein
MDISDKLINVCIIFAILAILAIVFGCYYFSGKAENFKDSSESEESKVIKEMTQLLLNNTPDKTIIEMMKKHITLFKNEKFVDKVVEALKTIDTDTESDTSSVTSEEPVKPVRSERSKEHIKPKVPMVPVKPKETEKTKESFKKDKKH